jgi:D-amino peptidase
MKIFVSADIEGVAGVVSNLQARFGERDYEAGRRLMTLEVNAAVDGAFAGGATEIVVCDAHANMQNLLPELLDERARLVRGAIRESLQMEGIDGTFAGAFVTGAHAAAGTQGGVLDHTWVSSSVFEIALEGTPLNEAVLNAYVAGHHGVPVLLVTGDDATIEQTEPHLPGVVGVRVKRGISRYAAESLHPKVAQARIRDGARRAVAGASGVAPLRVPDPLTMDVTFLRTDMADAAALVPGVLRTSARSIRFAGTPPDVFRMQELLLYRLRYELD